MDWLYCMVGFGGRGGYWLVSCCACCCCAGCAYGRCEFVEETVDVSVDVRVDEMVGWERGRECEWEVAVEVTSAALEKGSCVEADWSEDSWRRNVGR